MSSRTAAMAHLLAELKREMNGAVVGSMRYYGREYGLNYGVSLPTIRRLVRSDERYHRYAKYLYQQQVRELRLASFWYADPSLVTLDELPFWAEGLINSEVAQEAAFVLFCKVDGVENWLKSVDPLLQYCALLSLARRGDVRLLELQSDIINVVAGGSNVIVDGVVALLAAAPCEAVKELLKLLPAGAAASKIIDEITWRLEYQ